MQNGNDLFIINGVRFPAPDVGYEIVHSQTVKAGRNADLAIVGQKVGRRLWKINNLRWSGLDAQTWAEMKEALEDFFVPVTFTGDDNKRHTIHMYPGDTTGQPVSVSGLTYEQFALCSFNLIDCRWEEND